MICLENPKHFGGWETIVYLSCRWNYFSMCFKSLQNRDMCGQKRREQKKNKPETEGVWSEIKKHFLVVTLTQF